MNYSVSFSILSIIRYFLVHDKSELLVSFAVVYPTETPLNTNCLQHDANWH